MNQQFFEQLPDPDNFLFRSLASLRRQLIDQPFHRKMIGKNGDRSCEHRPVPGQHLGKPAVSGFRPGQKNMTGPDNIHPFLPVSKLLAKQ